MRPTLLGLTVVLLALGGFLLWSALAPLSGAIVAMAVVKVDNNRKTIQHLEGGIVHDILVRDGDRVAAGDTLILLESEQVAASVDVLRLQLDAELAKVARLEAERDHREQLSFPAELVQRAQDANVRRLLDAELKSFETRAAALHRQMDLISQQVDGVRREIAGLHEQTAALERAADHLREEIEANTRLENLKYVDRMRVLTLERNLDDYLSRRGESVADAAKAEQRIAELELRAIEIKDAQSQQAAADLTTARTRVFDLQERVRPYLDALDRQRIVAPIAGTVVGLKVFTLGGVIAPREPLLDIVPDDTRLIVEARIRVEDIDNVRVGQDAEVRLSAFSATEVAPIAGQVAYVSADRFSDGEDGLPYYIARVALDQVALAAAGQVSLAAGMPAEAFIRVKDRTALEYLLEPISRALGRALREV